MNPNTKDLVAQSLEHESDFSSSTHTLDTLVKEMEPQQSEYIIPSRYNKDTLRIILVNTKKYYIYWEVSDATLEKYNLDLNKEQLQFIIKDDVGNELFRFKSSFALGEYYLNTEFENMNICVKVEIQYGDEIIELLSSNMVHTFSSQINLPDENSEVWTKRLGAWTEVIKSSITYGSSASSDQYVKELERLRHFNEFEEVGVSSSTLIKEQ